MRIDQSLSLLGLVGLVACGSTPSTKLNAYLGTLNVAAGTVSATCNATHVVRFDAGSTGVNVHTVSAVVGDCLEFINDDTAPHWPSSYPLASCAELDAPAQLAHGASFTTNPPLAAVKSCNWQDRLNPPPPPGSGGGY